METFSDRLRSLFEKIDGYQQILELWVPGKPMPKGSMTAFARRKADGTIGVNMKNYSNSVGEWQSLVSYIARQSYFEPPVTTAVGKGNVEFWVAKVMPGKVLVELEGVSEEIAREAFRLAAAKLSVSTIFVKRQVR